MKYRLFILFSYCILTTVGLQSCKKSGSNTNSPGPTIEPKKIIVSTFAGSNLGGFVDGDATTVAKFNFPTGVAIGPSGKLYVADYLNGAVRVITTTGTVNTLAGNGTPGFSNGTGTTAQLYYPQQLTVDANENIFVVGGYNNIYDRIRKITASGTVTQIAGNGTPGFADGDGINAQFQNPFGIVNDLQGNLFVSDADNQKIRKINSLNYVTTFASGGLNEPTGITIDPSGNIFFCDGYNNKIKKITPAGVISTIAGTGVGGYKDGTADIAQFNWPVGIAADANGNLFIGDALNHCIRKISNSGAVSTYAGTGIQGYTDGDASVAKFNLPCQVAVNTKGDVFVADCYNNRIRKISLQ